MSSALVLAELQALAEQAAAEEEARLVARLRLLADLGNAMLEAWRASGVPDDEAIRLVLEWLPRVLAAADRR